MKYSYIKPANLDKLDKEIREALLPLDYLTMDGTQAVNVYTTTELDPVDKTILDNIMLAHTPVDVLATVQARVQSAMEFGRVTMAQYAATNVLAGYSIEVIQDIMARTTKVQQALLSGSLYVAIVEINAVETDATVITVAKIKNFRNQIEDYLGIPRT